MDRQAIARPAAFNVPLAPQIAYGQHQQQHQQQPPSQLQSQQQPQPPPQHRPPASIAAILQSPTRQYYPTLEDPIEAQSHMEAKLKRSVTLVYWYKAGCEPIRLHQEITTFPMFALSEFRQLVTDLELGPSTYVDAYNPHAGTWEQQTISAVRGIESEQRLLYRTRRSLLEGLADNECPGLDSEIRMQPPPRGRPPPTQLPSLPSSATANAPPAVLPSPITRPTKRLAPDSRLDTPNSPHKFLRPMYPQSTPTFPQSALPQGGPSGPHPPSTAPPTAPLPQIQPSPLVRSHPLSPFVQRDTPLSPFTPRDMPLATPQVSAPTNNPLPDVSQPSQASSEPSTSSPTIPHTAHPPLKRWPNDYAVCEISSGFTRMDNLIRQTPSLTQKSAFEKVFGCRYVKSTVCRHRGVWKRADKGLKETFEKMGTVEGALWGEFVKKTDFKRENGGSDRHSGHHVGGGARVKEQHSEVGVNGNSRGGPSGSGRTNGGSMMPDMGFHLPALGLQGLSGHSILGGDAHPPMASLAPGPSG